MGLVNAWKGFFTSNQDIFEQKPVKKRRRSYTGARVDRLSASWVTNQTSADQEWKQGIVKLQVFLSTHLWTWDPSYDTSLLIRDQQEEAVTYHL